MVYCHVHRTYHNGLRAKLSCIISVMRGIPLDLAVDKIRKVPEEKIPNVIHRTEIIWDDYNIGKTNAEDILKFEAIHKNTTRDMIDRLSLTRISVKHYMDLKSALRRINDGVPK